MRVCVFGDSAVNGTGDDACLGWVGRAIADARRAGRDITLYNLGIRRDTSADIAARWRAEALLRLPPGCDARLAFSFGANDCVEESGASRVPFDAAVAHTDAILRRARDRAPTIMVGPISVLDDGPVDRRIRELSIAQEQVCARLGVPFLAIHEFVATCPIWRTEAAAGDGVHPNGGGYAALGEFIARWSGFRRWLDRD